MFCSKTTASRLSRVEKLIHLHNIIIAEEHVIRNLREQRQNHVSL